MIEHIDVDRYLLDSWSAEESGLLLNQFVDEEGEGDGREDDHERKDQSHELADLEADDHCNELPDAETNHHDSRYVN